MFAEIDTDGDGFLTREEVIAYITKQGGTEEQANGTFDQLDTDKEEEGLEGGRLSGFRRRPVHVLSSSSTS